MNGVDVHEYLNEDTGEEVQEFGQDQDKCL